MPACHVISIPAPVPYLQALAWQEQLVRRRIAGEIPDTLLLMEHLPTITLGRRADPADLMLSADDAARRGIAIIPNDRGGEITYHAPGQLVGYPILDLRVHGQDLHRYLRDLEEVLIRALGAYGVAGEREAGLTGVWAGGRKIAAIGIKVTRWVTMHGFALNLTLDLTPFRRDFIPCGIRGRDVTSLAELLPGPSPRRGGAERAIIPAFADVFGLTPQFRDGAGIIPE